MDQNSKTISQLVNEAHENAKAHGWWENDKITKQPRSFGELIALCHSELSEALEDYRSALPVATMYYQDGKPCGIPSELADVLIRVFDMSGYYGIDLEKAVLEKMEYNRTRPYKHGNKVI